MFVLWLVRELLITLCHDTKLFSPLSGLLSSNIKRFLSLFTWLRFKASSDIIVMCPEYFFFCVEVFHTVCRRTGNHTMDHFPQKISEFELRKLNSFQKSFHFFYQIFEMRNVLKNFALVRVKQFKIQAFNFNGVYNCT